VTYNTYNDSPVTYNRYEYSTPKKSLGDKLEEDLCPELYGEDGLVNHDLFDVPAGESDEFDDSDSCGGSDRWSTWRPPRPSLDYEERVEKTHRLRDIYSGLLEKIDEFIASDYPEEESRAVIHFYDDLCEAFENVKISKKRNPSERRWDPNEVVPCSCGVSYTKSNKSAHFKRYHTEGSSTTPKPKPKTSSSSKDVQCSCGRSYTKSNKARHFKRWH